MFHLSRFLLFLQMELRALLQQVVLHLQLIRSRRKLHGITRDTIKQLKSSANAILNVITSWMVPSTYFEGISQLLEHTDKNVKKQVRLMLTPLLRIYSSALECGESSLSLVFEMLASMISSMDRSAIGTYHVKIFEHCLIALDLRRQLPESIKNINMAERSVIDAMTVLTMKLTETMFRPLFFHSLEWAESEFEGSDCIQSRSLDRSISFYNMVSKLTEHHRSLFVPYFKHLLEGCIRYLTEAHDVNEALAKRRKKAKVADSVIRSKHELLSLKQWHLRAVILKSLYKCFLFDNDLKLLDSTNFQVSYSA
ncbi:hypothetical protein BHM03_00056771 [Ensete ventricosum]|nr:hypothetical protein BHM03_00056771 [Ensete ventricosum]